MGPNLTRANSVAQGQDSLAEFLIHQSTPNLQLVCCACKEDTQLALSYSDKKVGGITAGLTVRGIKPPYNTLVVKTPTFPIGLTCGCYAKFHRQIAHITKGSR
jgi:hypothetical protein